MQMLAMEDFCQLDLRLAFSFLVGNSDMHLKNFSLIETEEGSEKYVLSPAYDLLPVNVIMPEDKEQFALAMNGKKTHIRRKDFLVFAEECGMTRGSAEKMIAMLVSKKREASGHVPRFPAAGAPERTPCKPDRRTGRYPGGLNCNFKNRTFVKRSLLWYNDGIKGGYHYS